MKYRVSPLMYSVNLDFYSTFRFKIRMNDPVDGNVLAKAVGSAILRYPYFSVCLKRQNEELYLQTNDKPVVVTPGEYAHILGSDESNGHLLSFSYEGNYIYMNASHFIADGVGTEPFLKTVLYLYVSEIYGTDKLDPSPIRMPGDEISPMEWEYPFPEEMFVEDDFLPGAVRSRCVYMPSEDEFDDGGFYSYNLRINQAQLMKKANTQDASPTTYLSVMLYRAFCSLEDNIQSNVVAHVQHQYRNVIGNPLSHHSLVSYIPAVFFPEMRDMSVDRQNTIIRGQIIIGSDEQTDKRSINRLVGCYNDVKDLPLEDKMAAMDGYVRNSILHKSFGISYVGKINWCGLENYIDDVNVYIGEKNIKNMILIEVLTLREFFTITFMQGGRSDKFVRAFISELQKDGVEAKMVSEEGYVLSDTVLPPINSDGAGEL